MPPIMIGFHALHNHDDQWLTISMDLFTNATFLYFKT